MYSLCFKIKFYKTVSKLHLTAITLSNLLSLVEHTSFKLLKTTTLSNNILSVSVNEKFILLLNMLMKTSVHTSYFCINDIGGFFSQNKYHYIINIFNIITNQRLIITSLTTVSKFKSLNQVYFASV